MKYYETNNSKKSANYINLEKSEHIFSNLLFADPGI